MKFCHLEVCELLIGLGLEDRRRGTEVIWLKPEAEVVFQPPAGGNLWVPETV